MTGMLIKDGKLLKEQKRFFLMSLLIMLLLLLEGDLFHRAEMVMMYSMMLFTMFTLSTLSYDEYENGMPYLFTMPVSRGWYAAEKYVFCFLMAAGSWLIAFAAVLLMAVLRGRGGDLSVELPALFMGSVTSFIIVMLMQALLLPLQLKFGGEKSRGFVLVILVAGFAVLYLFKDLFSRIGIRLDKMITGMEQASPVQLLVAACGITAVLTAVSFLISRKILMNKEF